MVFEEEGGILQELPERCVVVLQMNCKGDPMPGTPQVLANRYPGWWKSYRDFCSLYRNGYIKSNLGDVHAFKASDGLIVCGVLAQVGAGKNNRDTSWDAWEKGLKYLKPRLVSLCRPGEGWKVRVQRAQSDSEQEELAKIVRSRLGSVNADISFRKG